MRRKLESDSRCMLKVKIKSLEEEARIIKKEEKLASIRMCNHLYHHRITVVRYEARHSLIAYGFLRNLPYKAIENNTKTSPNWKRVRQLVKKYGSSIHEITGCFEQVETSLMERFDEWREEAVLEKV